MLKTTPVARRPLMEPVRQAARRLAARGVLDITQKGLVVDPAAFRGPIRLRLCQPREGRLEAQHKP